MSNAFSFSIPPREKEYKAAVLKLKEYSNRTGISFSFLVVQAILHYIEEKNL